MKFNWHHLPISQVLDKTKSSKNGLTQEEAEKKLQKSGANKLAEEKPFSSFKILLKQFKNPLIYILVIAAVIMLFLRDYIDALVIAGAVFINTTIGFIQENKASQALAKLRKLVKPKTIVIREGKQIEILASKLVVGDIIVVKPGNKVSADARLISVDNLKINEASLTGEWLPASKLVSELAEKTPLADRDNMIFMGTIVEEGSGQAVVIATGADTELGRIATLVQETKNEKTPFQLKLARLAKFISIIIGFICLIIFIVGLLNNYPFQEIFVIAVAVAVSAIPEGLPATMTVILAIGMQRILKKKGLTKTLLAAETLGSTSIICTDKTGTLTQAKMVVTDILTGAGQLLNLDKKSVPTTESKEKKDLLLAIKIASLCNESFVENPEEAIDKWLVRGRPTDRALLMSSVRAGLNISQLKKENPQIKTWPFDSERKFVATLHKKEENYSLYVSGAPERILNLCAYVHDGDGQQKLTLGRLKDLKEKYEHLTKDGLRLVGVAYRQMAKMPDDDIMTNKLKRDKVFQNFVLAGFIALSDPIRPSVIKSIKICQKAGMKVIISTGDHYLTARAVARQLGLPHGKENIIEGSRLESLTEKELQERLPDLSVYARVEPKDKIRIVEAWQNRGEVVAMTGDGINDAPALKKADIGVAVGSGTDVAKETADLILLNDNFSVIVKAVEQGRVLLDNLKKAIVYLLTASSTEVILIIGALLFKFPLPLLAAQILWVNLVTDSFPTLALAFEPKEKDIMEQKPRPKKSSLFDKNMFFIIFVIGIISSLIIFSIFIWLLKQNQEDITYIRTMIFALLGINSLFYIFSCKSLRQNIWQTDLLSNKYLLGSIIIGIVTMAGAIYLPALNFILKTVPLRLTDALIVFLVSLISISGIEFSKWLSRKNRNKIKHA